jgi:hypothetical protein
MPQAEGFLKIVRKAAGKRILFLPHAVRQMSRPDRMISTQEIEQVVEKGEIIEDYPGDVRGHTCLMLGRGAQGRPLHVVCCPKEDFLAIITAYVPSATEWENNFRKRRKK